MSSEEPTSSETYASLHKAMQPIQVAGGLVQVRPVTDPDRDAAVAISSQHGNLTVEFTLNGEQAEAIATRMLEYSQRED